MESGQKVVVLVAEDEALIRMEAADVLKEAGFEVIEASRAEEALSALQTRQAEICVLFTDIHMPGSMDGVALAHHTHRYWPWVGILLASGNGRPAPAELPDKSQFVPKPYDPYSVIDRIRELVADR